MRLSDGQHIIHFNQGTFDIEVYFSPGSFKDSLEEAKKVASLNYKDLTAVEWPIDMTIDPTKKKEFEGWLSVPQEGELSL